MIQTLILSVVLLTLAVPPAIGGKVKHIKCGAAAAVRGATLTNRLKKALQERAEGQELDINLYFATSVIKINPKTRDVEFVGTDLTKAEFERIAEQVSKRLRADYRHVDIIATTFYKTITSGLIQLRGPIGSLKKFLDAEKFHGLGQAALTDELLGGPHSRLENFPVIKNPPKGPQGGRFGGNFEGPLKPGKGGKKLR